MSKDLTKVFVYGTLKAGRPLDRKMFADVRTKVDEAKIDGSIYNLGWYPTVRLDEKGTVHGEVHTFKKEDIKSIIQIMDGIEGYREDRPAEANLYTRKVITAQLKNGEKVKAYIYEINRLPKSAQKLENGVWEPEGK